MSKTPCNFGDCVKVMTIGGGRKIVWSSRREEEQITIDKDEWDTFVAAIKSGDYDEE